MEWTFYEGRRVKRRINVYDEKSKYKYGEIAYRYSMPERTYGDLTLLADPECYAVRWDNGKLEEGFFAHGLTAMTHEEIMRQIELKTGLG